MYLKSKIFSSLFIGGVLLASCTKTADGVQGPPGPAGANGNSATDNRSGISGYVQLVDQFTQTLSVNDSVVVSTMMGDSALSVTTDATGLFLLPNLKSGTYRIMFKRNGFDSLAVNVKHSAGNEDKFIGIIQMAGTQTTHFVSQSIQLLASPFDNVSKYADILSSITGPPITGSTQRFINMYFSSSSSVNASNYLYLFQTYTHNEGTNQMETQAFFGGTAISSPQFQPGDTVYVKTYIVPPYFFENYTTSWFDTNTYKSVAYPYVGDSTLNYFIWVN
jgi:hypothetical protein